MGQFHLMESLKNHLHDEKCNVDECQWMKGRVYDRKCSCGDILHATESDWDDYDYGSGIGYVYFQLMCDTCHQTSKREG